jgi:cytochrome c oxidase subunit III
MPVVVIFLSVVLAVMGWWLLQQRLTAKPWLEEGVIGEYDGTGSMAMPPAKIAVWVLIAVIGSLFALLASAYFMRMGYSDWRPIAVPQVLWLSTASLVMTSIALHGAKRAVDTRYLPAVKVRIIAAGFFGVAFVTCQLLAWRELSAEGFLLATNPADSFFYLGTGLHGLHVLGGLIALAWTANRTWKKFAPETLRLNVELCATYWHFLLIVWLVLFSLLTGFAQEFGELCGRLLT